MDSLSRIGATKAKIFQGALSLAVAAGLSFVTAGASADVPTTMAPPIQMSAPATSGDNASADSVFHWQEVPANQQVPLVRAAFDQGGYQLYDTQGETIIVPFTDQNLYVMKFAQSSNGKMYFVNEGDYPVLYVPKNGYLENATVAGARWYPFGEDFHPDHPVFLGIAPSWSVFIGMGWYPHMVCYGGYWSNTSFIAGGIFLPSVGLFFEIGGHPYYGWDAYHRYFLAHPAPFQIAYDHRDFYRWADRPHASLHRFVGAGHVYYAHRSFAGAHDFSGGRTFRGASGSWQGGHGAAGDRASGGDRTYGDDRGYGGDRGGRDDGGDRGFGRDGGFGGGDRHFRG